MKMWMWMLLDLGMAFGNSMHAKEDGVLVDT